MLRVSELPVTRWPTSIGQPAAWTRDLAFIVDIYGYYNPMRTQERIVNGCEVV